MYSAPVVAVPPNPKDMYRRRDWLVDLLNMSRAQRRARGIRVTNAQLQHELGAVQYVIEQMEDTAVSSPWGNRLDESDTATLDPN